MALKKIPIGLFLFLCTLALHAQQVKWKLPEESVAGTGWAGNSVNTVIFRKNAICSGNGFQFTAYYDKDANVVLGKRSIGQPGWELVTTRYKGNITDAHRSISIALDGDGFLHMAWDHHNSRLRYCKSTTPYSLTLSDEITMTGLSENKLSYPEFYRVADGSLLFFYRDGGSGNGNLVINKYSLAEKKWSRLQDNLISGESKRNAYWQACTDLKGNIHISWVWRESPDVASNHDLCYAVSRDGGLTWEKSTGEKYKLPVTEATAEVAIPVPQNSELINQTSMFADERGLPSIAGYWKGKHGIPQYKLVYLRHNKWICADLGFRETGFSLSGMGTKQIPIARPQLIGWNAGRHKAVALLFRDAERGNKVSVASALLKRKIKWKISDLTLYSTGAWEPLIDLDCWKESRRLFLFVQEVTQADGEGLTGSTPTSIKIIECGF